MSDLEEEMRRALFGAPGVISPEPIRPSGTETKKPKRQSSSSFIRVTLTVSKDFEGETELFVYEASTLSTISAEIDAKNAAKKKKYKYVDVVSIEKVN